MPTSRRVSRVGLTRSGAKAVKGRSGGRIGAAKRTREVFRSHEPGEPPPAVGQVLRRARKHLELSLREVERRIGRSNAYLSQVERGLIRQPDPLVLFQLSELYRLNFVTLASWAGWSDPETQGRQQDYSEESVRQLLRLILQLDEAQRNEVLAVVEGLLKASRT